MYIKSINIEVVHDDIVNILSSLYTANDFLFAYKSSDYQTIPEDERIGDCLEDKCADCLIHGFKICVTDYYAEEEVHGWGKDIEHEVNEDGSVDYFVSLNDFKKGLQQSDAIDYVLDMIKENDDYWTAYNLIQFILFGELIYG